MLTIFSACIVSWCDGICCVIWIMMCTLWSCDPVCVCVCLRVSDFPITSQERSHGPLHILGQHMFLLSNLFIRRGTWFVPCFHPTHRKTPRAFPTATQTNSPGVLMPAVCIYSFAWINSHRCIMRAVLDYPETGVQKQAYSVTWQCCQLGLHFRQRVHLWPLKCRIGAVRWPIRERGKCCCYVFNLNHQWVNHKPVFRVLSAFLFTRS